MEIKYKNLFENKVKAIKPFNLSIQTLLNEIKINPKIIHNILPVWTIHESVNSKTRTNQIIQNQNTLHYFLREISQHPVMFLHTNNSRTLNENMKPGAKNLTRVYLK